MTAAVSLPTTGLEQVLPHDPDAEEAVLGAILINGKVIDRIAGFLLPDHFFDARRREVFFAMLRLYEKGIDIGLISMRDALTKGGLIEAAGGSAYLTQLASVVATELSVESSARIVYRHAIRRAIYETAQKGMQIALDESVEPDEAITLFDGEVQKMLGFNAADSWKSMDQLLTQVFSDLSDRMEGRDTDDVIASGIGVLDHKMDGGMRRKNLITIAGRAGMGKTMFAVNIAHGVAKKLYNEQRRGSVGIFEMEMGAEEIATRLLCIETQVRSVGVKTGVMSDGEFDRLVSGIGRMQQYPIFVDDTPAMTIPQIRAKARRLQAERGLDLLIIDHVGLVSGTASYSRVTELTKITSALKSLSKELRVPVLMLAQLNRGPDLRADHEPMVADLRESGSIEQDSDIVMMVYREGHYDPECENPNKVDIIIPKYRDGVEGRVALYFNGETCTFRGLQPA